MKHDAVCKLYNINYGIVMPHVIVNGCQCSGYSRVLFPKFITIVSTLCHHDHEQVTRIGIRSSLRTQCSNTCE